MLSSGIKVSEGESHPTKRYKTDSHNQKGHQSGFRDNQDSKVGGTSTGNYEGKQKALSVTASAPPKITLKSQENSKKVQTMDLKKSVVPSNDEQVEKGAHT